MSRYTEKELFANAGRVAGKVVLVTGGGSGIGRDIALLFSRHGAKIAIGDINTGAASATAQDIIKAGGAAIWQKCDVALWEDQESLFKKTKDAFGTIDIVIANAGIIEKRGSIDLAQKDGIPQKPDLKVVDVNLQGVIYTSTLGMHYFKADASQTADSQRLKAVIVISSLSALYPLSAAPFYTASKFGVLGFHGAIASICARQGIRTGCVLPWFADTALTVNIKENLKGTPLVTTELIAAACLAAATDPNPQAAGCGWPVAADGYVYRLSHKELISSGAIKLRASLTAPAKPQL